MRVKLNKGLRIAFFCLLAIMFAFSALKNLNALDSNSHGSISWQFNILNQTYLTFDGDGDYVEAPNFAWNFSGGPVTVLFWNKVNTNQLKYSSAFGVGTSSDNLNRFQAHVPYPYDPRNKKVCWDYGSYSDPGGRISADYPNYLNKWTHVALVSEGNNGHFKGIYLDGELKNSTSNSDGPNINLTGLTIGKALTINYHNGSIDEFMIFNRRLSTEEIQTIYNAGRAADLSSLGISGLYAYYSFNEGSGDNVEDSSGNGNKGIKYNNTTWKIEPLLNISKIIVKNESNEAYVLFNNTDTSSSLSLTLNNLTNALIYFEDGSVGGSTDTKANSGSATITIPAGKSAFIFDDFALTNTSLKNSPLSFSSVSSTTKHIASSLTQTINAKVKIQVDSCKIKAINYSNSSAVKKIYYPADFSCAIDATPVVSIYLEGIEAGAGNELVIEYLDKPENVLQGLSQNGWLNFDGDGDYVEAPNFAWNFSGGPVTVLFWNKVNTNQVKIVASSAFGVGLDMPTTSLNRFQAHAPYGKILYWDYGNITGNGRVSANYTDYLNKWSHVALVSEGNNGHFKGIYLDGSIKNSTTNSDGPNINLTGLTIGKAFTNSFHRGSIDEFMIFNRRLSTEEIQTIYNAGRAANLSSLGISGLYAYYSFNEGSGDKVYDLSENGFNGTIYNAAWNKKVSLDYDYLLLNNTDANDLSLTLNNLTNALIYFEDGSVGGSTDTKANSGSATITIPAGKSAFIFDDFALTEGTPLKNSPLSFSSVSSTTKHIASSLMQTINAKVAIKVENCSIKEIRYTSNSSAVKKTYSTADFSCVASPVPVITLYIEGLEPAESSNELVIEYETPYSAGDGGPSGAGGGGGGGGALCTTNWNCTEWSACLNGTQTRNCTKAIIYCYTNETKPLEMQNCTEEKTNQTALNQSALKPEIMGEETKSPFSAITGAVTGAVESLGKLPARTRNLIIVAVIIGLLIITFLIDYKVNKSKPTE
jgi:hypothetical protein